MYYKGKNTKSIISQKLRIAKMSAKSIPIYSANLDTFEESWVFGCPKRLIWTLAAPKQDMMWYEILRPSFFLGHYASFMSRWPLLMGRMGGLHIRRWEITLQWHPIRFHVQLFFIKSYCNCIPSIVSHKFESYPLYIHRRIE